MPFIKVGELIEISRVENTESCIPAVSAEVLDNFRKIAANLKKVAPRAEDFLYFSAVMMHAAEASGINDDGTPKLNGRGDSVKVGWDKKDGTWKWTTNDPGIKPYKNSNGDIFPEEELVKAYKKWIHKPLCIDHKSSSVDHVRGFIVDTYYDRDLKRVIALCALDKHNYPDLARKVSTGYSNCVSMGTAVGRAICTEAGCHRVARAESDFCTHMKNKTCYGEINIDLNPIELSIVVNGADPKANIKHIIAAANTLNSYIETKSKELTKIAKLEYQLDATLTAIPGPGDPSVGSQLTVTGNNLAEFKRDVEEAIKELEAINKSVKEIDNNTSDNTNDLAFTQSSELNDNDVELAPPHDRYASESISINELRKITSSIENKLNYMKQSLNKLSQNTNTYEENMSSKEMNKKGYYQGTEDPTPGQAKYPKDPLNEKLRMDGDKHMDGQGSFPDVGPVDGLYPGVDSTNMSELDRKKMLARATAEERAIRRQAIVNLAKQALDDKKAYYQNGDDKNPGSPTPGQVKYPIDKGHMAYEDDKHMHGQKPFPDVGSVDGMHPSPASADISDEKKRKEMLSRANTLHGRFVRASKLDGTRDLENSTWEIRLGEKLLLSASVRDLSGGRSEMMYDSINTPEFGQRLLEKVKVYGADRVKALVKSGQTASPPPPADVAPPADAAVPPMGEDTGKTGDPKESALELAEKVRDVSSDLVEAVRALTGEQAEMGADMTAPPADMGATASDEFSTEHMNILRGEINESLTFAMKEAIAELNDHQQELEMIAGMYDKGAVTTANENFVGSIVEDAISEAKTAVATGFGLITAFVKYARGTKAIVKRAEIEAELEALAEGETMSTDSDLMNLIQDTNSDLDSVEEMMASDEELGDLDDFGGDSELESDFDLEDDPLESMDIEEEEIVDEDLEDFSADDNDLMAKPEELKNLDVKPGTHVQVTAADFNSRSGRTALRAKLAADALGKQDDGQLQDMSKARFSDMLDEADSLTNGQTKLDIKPSDDLGYVETLPEVNKKMMDLAKAPPKVRKEAEAIHKLVSEGSLDPADLDALVSEGLDKDAVAYYKKYYGQTEGGGEFASELVKEHVKAELEEELNKYRVKLARSYEAAYDMVDRGLCYKDKVAISSQVDEIMKFNDESFNTLKKVIARHAPVTNKEAGRMPQVGMIGSGEIVTTASNEDEWSLLSAALSKTSNRTF